MTSESWPGESEDVEQMAAQSMPQRAIAKTSAPHRANRQANHRTKAISQRIRSCSTSPPQLPQGFAIDLGASSLSSSGNSFASFIRSRSFRPPILQQTSTSWFDGGRRVMILDALLSINGVVSKWLIARIGKARGYPCPFENIIGFEHADRGCFYWRGSNC